MVVARPLVWTDSSQRLKKKKKKLFTYARRSRWSIGHLRPLAIALWSGLLWPFQSSWSLAVSALLQCLASNCCEAGLSSSSPAGSRSGLGVWCWMLASWGCVRSSPTSSAVSAWPLVTVPLALTDLHIGEIACCRDVKQRNNRLSDSTFSHQLSQLSYNIRWSLFHILFWLQRDAIHTFG